MVKDKLPKGIRKYLSSLGVTPVQSLVFEYIFQNPKTTCKDICLATEISKSTVSYSLQQLAKEQLIKRQTIGRKQYYDVENHQVVLEKIESDYQVAVHRLTHKYDSLKDYWCGQYTTSSWQAEVVQLEGEHIKYIYEDLLTSAADQIVYTYGDNLYTDSALQDYIQDYIDRRVSKGIRSEVISPLEHSNITRQLQNKRHNRSCELLPKDQLPTKGEVRIYGNKIAFLGQNNDHPIGFIIENKPLANMLKTLFKHHKLAIETLRDNNLLAVLSTKTARSKFAPQNPADHQ
jgi:sugar-specific transcriptional regulator TrmB